MLESSTDPQNEKITSPNTTNRSSLPRQSKLSVDLEAARSLSPNSNGARPPTTSPITLRSIPPGIFHSNGSVPASVTSLPERGIESAPTHRRRRKRRRGQGNGNIPGGNINGNTAGTPGATVGFAGISGDVVIRDMSGLEPRRANSLPANPHQRVLAMAAAGDGVVPIDWKNGLDTLMKPAKKIVGSPTLTQCFANTLKYSWLNVLLVVLPVAWIVHFTHQRDVVVFVFTFISIIPLAALLGFATEELANYTGPTIGGLFNATFGNAVELIISILALVKGQLRIVQAAMLGSILSNCLLVLGMCFLAGGLRFHEQGYGVRMAQQHISLLSLCVFSVSIPAAFSSSVSQLHESDILSISRGTSIILLVCYVAFLVFQLWTHSYLYTIESSKRHAAATFLAADEGSIAPPIGQSVFRVSSIFTHSSTSDSSLSTSQNPTSPSAAARRNGVEGDRRSILVQSPVDATIQPPIPPSMDDEEEAEPKLTVKFALILLLATTVLTGLTAEFLVDSIHGLIETTHVTEEFVALILLPLVGNAAEHVTAVTVSVRNKLDLALAVAVGSSIQIALFVLPFLVLLGWCIGQPLSLNFDVFETVVVVISVIVVNFAISDGRTNWLEGFVLMITYILIGLAVFYYEGDGTPQ